MSEGAVGATIACKGLTRPFRLLAKNTPSRTATPDGIAREKYFNGYHLYMLAAPEKALDEPLDFSD